MPKSTRKVMKITEKEMKMEPKRVPRRVQNRVENMIKKRYQNKDPRHALTVLLLGPWAPWGGVGEGKNKQYTGPYPGSNTLWAVGPANLRYL